MNNKQVMLNTLGLEPSSPIYQYYIVYGGFNNENPEFDDIYSLNELYESNVTNNYWTDVYPQILDQFIMLSSIEGEGSYFYSKTTGEIFDVSWSEMDSLINNKLSPRWASFKEFESAINES